MNSFKNIPDETEFTEVPYKMRWGKHRNKTLQYIKKKEPNYITWLCNSEYVHDSCPELLRALLQLR